VLFGTKRLRTIGSDLGAAMKGFKQAVSDGESEEGRRLGNQDARGISAPVIAHESEVKVTPKHVA